MPKEDRPHWYRRHPFATGLWIVYALITAIAFVDDPAAGGGFAVLAVVLAPITWAVTASIDRWKNRRSPPVMPRAATGISAGQWSMPHASLALPQSPSDLSAFEETTHQPLHAEPGIAPFQAVTLGDLLEMTPTEFEQLCVRALAAIGFRDVRRTGGAGDLAADIAAKDVQGRSCIVQCKRYAPGSNVGSPTVQMFIGMKAVHHKADRGVIMTTAEFSRPAVDLAKQHDIVLIDGDDIVKIVNLTGAK